ncbi:KAT8 regulatory NSL complex subunit 1-like [Ascaphus truei]|uniref:KAT8 regulatory NSL complex subunit 1-like n=1 Tax=Ascaphus truei TaxID=8439 RepID=UPI003F597894
MRVPSPMSASARHTTHSPLTRQLSVPSEGATPYHTNSATARRRRTESASFDINNIVIPMSVAASTRPERLQYKEILTPSWRVVHITPLSGCEEAPEELEDLSDAAFCALHTACEETERLRWVSSPSAALQRRGSRSHRSSDGCITPQPPGGAPHLTPQPPSPDSWYPLPDFLFPPSPLSPDTLSAPPTPASRDDPWLPSEETRSTVSESEPEPAVVQPWERRYFPLPYNPKTEGDGPWDPRDRGGPRPPRRASCSSKTAKEADGPPSSQPAPDPPPNRGPCTDRGAGGVKINQRELTGTQKKRLFGLKREESAV